MPKSKDRKHNPVYSVRILSVSTFSDNIYYKIKILNDVIKIFLNQIS